MERLRRRADFLAVAGGARMTSPAFVLQRIMRADGGPVRVGFTVSRKVGTATERNRVRRRLRDLVRRLDASTLTPHSDYVLVGRRTALIRNFTVMLDDLTATLHRLESRRHHRQAIAPMSETPHDR